MLTKISDKEQDAIMDYIATYGGKEGEGADVEASVDFLLRFWNINKYSLYKMMRENLILERQVDILKPKKILLEDMEHAFYPNGTSLKFINEYYNFCYKMRKEDFWKYNFLENLVDFSKLIDNVYTGDDVDIPVPGRKHPVQIHNGCKIMRVLGKIAKEFNLEGFEEFRIQHSMVLNQKRLKGTMCLSIHPLDYMTMSDNNCDWDSCMSWQNGGEYRMGTVECMNSEYILVAYLKQEEDMILVDDFKWNSKRWRKLYVITPELITGIKGYPFEDEGLDNVALNWIKELVNPGDYYDTKFKFKNTKENIFQISEEENVKVYIHLYFRIMYNDIYSNHTMFLGKAMKDIGLSYHKNLSGETECMSCGKDLTSCWQDHEFEMIICPECSGVRKCPECGEYVSECDIVTLANGEYMCEYCARHSAVECASCCEFDRDYNMYEVYPQHREEILEYESINICKHCSESIYREIGKYEIYPNKNKCWTRKRVVNTKNFTDSGYALFGYFGATRERMREENKKSKKFWIF